MIPEMQRRLERELERTAGADAGAGSRMLRNLHAGLSRVQPGMVPPDRVGYGSRLRVRNLATGAEESWTVMSGEYIDLDDEQVSVESPVGQALLGARAGERVAVETPGGVRRFEVLEVVTLPQRLGLADQPEALRVVGSA